MALALLVTRLLLAVVFVIAGLAKLADLKGSREAMRGFGLREQKGDISCYPAFTVST